MGWIWMVALAHGGDAWERCSAGDPCMKQIEAACAGGRGDVCTLVGRATESKPKQAQTYFARACELGDAEGCERLAFLGADHPGLKIDAAAQHVLHANACDLGYTTACVNVAAAIRAGTSGVPADPAEADRILEAACETTARACLLRAKAAPDPASAYPWVERSCAGGDSVGCEILGQMRRDGDGTSQDAAGAVEAFRKACDAGSADACANARALGG